MARPLRIEYASALYHVTSRGNERKDVITSQPDRKKFLYYVESAAKKKVAGTIAWQKGSEVKVALGESVASHVRGCGLYRGQSGERTPDAVRGRRGLCRVCTSAGTSLREYVHVSNDRLGRTTTGISSSDYDALADDLAERLTDAIKRAQDVAVE